MKLSIIHPSRSRPEQAYVTFRKWAERAADWGNFEYILTVDIDQYDIYYSFFYKVMHKVKLMSRDNKSAIEAINVCTANVATGDIFIVVSDDFDCPEHWDILLLQALEGKSDFIVKTQDGLQKTLITLPIMDRKYYNRFGYIYHPDYIHMHCDEEMTIVGHMLGKVITLDLLFPHNHYSTGKMAMDAINVKNNATWAHGQATIDRRAKDNFGIKNPLIKREDIVWI